MDENGKEEEETEKKKIKCELTTQPYNVYVCYTTHNEFICFMRNGSAI